jgi:hypothetical protein
MSVMLYQPFPPWTALNDLFGRLAEWFRSPPPPQEPEDDLRTCRFCGQPFVGPLECRAEGSGRRILLRCGNCDCRRRVFATNEQASRLECDVARDIATINRAVERCDVDRFADQADAFAAALERDLIDASDFT